MQKIFEKNNEWDFQFKVSYYFEIFSVGRITYHHHQRPDNRYPV